MKRFNLSLTACILLWIGLPWRVLILPAAEPDPPKLLAGFAEADVTPSLAKHPVFLAGFGKNRRAAKIHDPLMVRAVVFKHGGCKLALASLDLIGMFHSSTARIRRRLPGFTYVLVSCTHNHDGPDTMGLWGPHPFASGVDRDYLQRVEDEVVRAVQAADAHARPVDARLGAACAPELLHDGREPYLKHDELTAIHFRDDAGRSAGLLVQWNCHPETLGSGNTEISADFVGATVQSLQRKYLCPVVYFTGTVGGLMTSLQTSIKDEQGNLLGDGTFAKAERYGQLAARVAETALKKARNVQLTPLHAQTRQVFLPLHNPLYQLARRLGVLDRQAYLWTGNASKAAPAGVKDFKKPLCMRTEVAYLRLGDLQIAAIPGEIYPELVLDRVQTPADAGADFPNAPVEPAIYKQMPGPYRMIIGLANDEIGYIIPKRQWDEKPPFCYGRKEPQYGESNSVGPETAPLLCDAFRKLVQTCR